MTGVMHHQKCHGMMISRRRAFHFPKPKNQNQYKCSNALVVVVASSQPPKMFYRSSRSRSKVYAAVVVSENVARPLLTITTTVQRVAVVPQLLLSNDEDALLLYPDEREPYTRFRAAINSLTHGRSIHQMFIGVIQRRVHPNNNNE